MTNATLGHVLRYVLRLAGPGAAPDLTDGELLHRFRTGLPDGDGTAVIPVCRRCDGPCNPAQVLRRHRYPR